MKRLVTGLLTALALSLGALTIGPATHADATPHHVEHATAVDHNFDNTSLYVCAATRPDSSWTVYGSHALWVVPDNAGYRCWVAQYSTGRHWCYDSQHRISTGAMWRIGGPWDASVCGTS